MFDTNVNLMPLVMVVLTSIGIPLASFFLKLGVEKLAAVLKPRIGEDAALVFQQRVDALLDKAIGEAAMAYLPQLQARGLTVDIGNLLAARAVGYAVNHAPDMAEKAKTFEGSLEEKIRARLLVHPAVQVAANLNVAPAAPGAGAPIELHAAAA